MVVRVDGKSYEYGNAVKLSDIASDIYGKNHGQLLAKVNGK